MALVDLAEVYFSRQTLKERLKYKLLMPEFNMFYADSLSSIDDYFKKKPDSPRKADIILSGIFLKEAGYDELIENAFNLLHIKDKSAEKLCRWVGDIEEYKLAKDLLGITDSNYISIPVAHLIYETIDTKKNLSRFESRLSLVSIGNRTNDISPDLKERILSVGFEFHTRTHLHNVFSL